MSAHGPFGRKEFTDDQKAKIHKDRKTMTLQELVYKWGGSIGGMQKICAKGEK